MELLLQFSVGKLCKFVGVLIWKGKKSSRRDRSTESQFAQGKILFLQVKCLFDYYAHLRMLTVKQGSKNIFLPGSKRSTFIPFYTLSSSFPIYHPILSLYLSLILSFPFLPFFLSLLSSFLPFLIPFSLHPSWEIWAFQLPSWYCRNHATSFFWALRTRKLREPLAPSVLCGHAEISDGLIIKFGRSGNNGSA